MTVTAQDPGGFDGDAGVPGHDDRPAGARGRGGHAGGDGPRAPGERAGDARPAGGGDGPRGVADHGGGNARAAGDGRRDRCRAGPGGALDHGPGGRDAAAGRRLARDGRGAGGVRTRRRAGLGGRDARPGGRRAVRGGLGGRDARPGATRGRRRVRDGRPRDRPCRRPAARGLQPVRKTAGTRHPASSRTHNCAGLGADGASATAAPATSAPVGWGRTVRLP